MKFCAKRLLVVGFCMLLVLPVSSVIAEPVDFEQRLKMVSLKLASGVQKIPFRETQIRPDTSEQQLFADSPQFFGWLYYDATSATLNKEIVAPIKTRMVLAEDFAEIHRGDRVRRLPKKAASEVVGLFVIFTAFITDNPDSVKQYFEIQYSEPNGWLISLVPRSARLKSYIERIDIRGVDDQLVSFESTRRHGGQDLLEIVDAKSIPE
jgi:hypothetical protein